MSFVLVGYKNVVFVGEFLLFFFKHETQLI